MARTRRITQFPVRGLKRRITIFDGSKLVCRITQFPVRTETRLRKDPACILDPPSYYPISSFLDFHRKQDILIRSRMIDCLGA